MSSFKTPESLSQSIVRHLEEEIIEGRIQAGLRLIPEELAKVLKVSKSPVREALMSLKSDGLVTSRPRAGFFVAEIKISDIEEIYPIRAVLTSLALRFIIEKRYESDFVPRLEEFLEEMARLVEEKDVIGYFHLNVDFWNFIFNRCPNKRLKVFHKQLGKQVLRFRFFSLSQLYSISRSYERHQRLLHAIKSRDAESAKKIAEEIIYSALDIIRRSLTRDSVQEIPQGTIPYREREAD